jgi:hypothetical protein
VGGIASCGSRKRPHFPGKESWADTTFFTTVRRIYRERIERTIMERLDAVDFSDRRINTLSGRGMWTGLSQKNCNETGLTHSDG